MTGKAVGRPLSLRGTGSAIYFLNAIGVYSKRLNQHILLHAGMGS
jgi:hypothetical protein